MIRSPRRRAGRSRVVLASLVAAGGVLLAGCGAGQQAQTAEQRPTIDGTNAEAGADIALRDIAIEYPLRGRYPQGADARLRMVVVNEGLESDALVEVRTDAAERVVFAPAGAAGEAGTAERTASPTPEPTPTPTPSGSATPSASGTPSESAAPSESPTPSEPPTTRIEIPANGLVSFRGDGPAVILTGLTRALRPSEVVPITFVFERGGAVTVDVAVAVPEREISPAPTVPVGGEE